MLQFCSGPVLLLILFGSVPIRAKRQRQSSPTENNGEDWVKNGRLHGFAVVGSEGLGHFSGRMGGWQPSGTACGVYGIVQCSAVLYAGSVQPVSGDKKLALKEGVQRSGCAL